MGRTEKNRFARIDALFQGAVGRDPAERDAWLGAQDEDPSIVEEVRALLAEDAAGTHDLEDIVDDGLRDAADTMEKASALDDAGTATLAGTPRPAAEPVPESIGPYRVLGSLGRGGLATVYLVERRSEFSMPVALKRIRRGMDTDDIVERLRLERQILARLVHPNIARLHDGGADDDGQPYLVMEVIEGDRIDQYCAKEELSTKGCLELFRQACEAVDFAHQNLILHRDLKPSNILVTEDGTLKLLDFGIAKVLAGGSQAEQTATEKRLLTPDYASPEQLRGELLTTASDIYSLGVVLFQLLTGRLPHDLSPVQLWSGDRPDAPLVSRTAAKERETSNQRTPKLDRWGLAAAVEIDAILAKTLETEPGRRYGSARELDEDIARLLDDRPVLARRPTLGYRLAKLARRHRALVTIGALAVLSLVVGIVGTSWQAQVAGRERLRAEQGQAQAEAVADFLVELFDVSDPYGEARLVDNLGDFAGPRGHHVTARELLDSAALRISGDFADDPVRGRRLRRTMARAYFSLSLYDEARGLLEDALKVEAPLGDTDALGRALVLRDLGRLDAWQTHFEIAEIQLLDAEAQLLRLGAVEEHAETLEYLGELEYWRENGPASETHYRRAEALLLELHGAESLAVARARAGLAKALHLQDRHDEIIRLLHGVLDVRRARLGDDHPLVLETQNDLAVELISEDSAAAAQTFANLLERQRRLLGPDHADLMSTLFNLATVRDTQGQREEASALLEEAWRVAGVRGARATPSASDILLLQGRLEHIAGRLDVATERYDEALTLRRRLYGDRHAETAKALLRLGRLLVELGDERARPLMEEALATSGALGLGFEHWVYLGLGELEMSLGRYDAAREHFVRGLEEVGPDQDWTTGILQLRLAQAMAKGAGDDAARLREALDAARSAEDQLKGSTLPEGHAWTLEAEALRRELEESY